jgi:hypothetical protein
VVIINQENSFHKWQLLNFFQGAGFGFGGMGLKTFAAQQAHLTANRRILSGQSFIIWIDYFKDVTHSYLRLSPAEFLNSASGFQLRNPGFSVLMGASGQSAQAHRAATLVD